MLLILRCYYTDADLSDFTTGDPIARQLLVEEYPEVNACLKGFIDSLDRQHMIPFLSYDEKTSWAAHLLWNIEQSYLASSLTILMERVDSVFVNIRAPVATAASQQPLHLEFEEISFSSIRSLAQSVTHRLQSCKANYPLKEQMSQHLFKVVSYFASRIDQLQVRTERAAAVSIEDLYAGSRFVLPVEKRFNANLYNALFVMEQVLGSMVVSLGTVQQQQQQQQQHVQEGRDNSNTNRQECDRASMDRAKAILCDAIEALEAQSRRIVEPVFSAITRHCEEVLGEIHKQYGLTVMSPPSTIGTLPYVEKLERDLKYIRQLHLSVFDARAPSFESCCVSLASSVLQCMAKQVALLRPMTDNVKLRLATEMAQIEHIVSSTVFPQLQRTGRAFTQYRAMRSVLFCRTSDIVGPDHHHDHPEGTPLAQFMHRNRTIDRQLLVLLLFSHLDKVVPPQAATSADLEHTAQQLPSPHTAMGMTPPEYIRWMDQRSPSEIAAQVGECVERCLQSLSQFDQEQALQRYFDQQQQQQKEEEEEGPEQTVSDLNYNAVGDLGGAAGLSADQTTDSVGIADLRQLLLLLRHELQAQEEKDKRQRQQM